MTMNLRPLHFKNSSREDNLPCLSKNVFFSLMPYLERFDCVSIGAEYRHKWGERKREELIESINIYMVYDQIKNTNGQ